MRNTFKHFVNSDYGNVRTLVFQILGCVYIAKHHLNNSASFILSIDLYNKESKVWTKDDKYCIFIEMKII